MTTETWPDHTIEAWSDRLEEQLTDAGMVSQQARAYRLAFELGLTRLISQTATKQELKDGLADLRDELRREMEVRFDAMQLQLDQRFDAMQQQTDQRFDAVDQRFDAVDRQFDSMQQLILAKFEEAKQVNRVERWLTRVAVAFIVVSQVAQLLS